VVRHRWRDAVEADGAGWGGGTTRRGPRKRPAVGVGELEDADGGVGGGTGGSWRRRGACDGGRHGAICDGSEWMDKDPIGGSLGRNKEGKMKRGGEG
jgi:hypothetical protein